METKKKIVNQQPQKEEKKQNKFVAWWLGLGKWAKVGLCAGTAAVLATAITLPIVLTNKGGATKDETFEIKFDEGAYKTDTINNLKKDVEYTFVANINDTEIRAFKIVLESGEGASLAHLSNTQAECDKKDVSNWSYLTDMEGNNDTSFGHASDTISNCKLTIKTKVKNNINNCYASLEVGGK